MYRPRPNIVRTKCISVLVCGESKFQMRRVPIKQNTQIQNCLEVFLRISEMVECVIGCVLLSSAYYYGKKKKPTKPCGGEFSMEGDVAKPARRRKKRKSIFVQKKRRSSAVDYQPAGSPLVRRRLPVSNSTHPALFKSLSLFFLCLYSPLCLFLCFSLTRSLCLTRFIPLNLRLCLLLPPLPVHAHHT